MEVTTLAAGALFMIDPLDQPGVEAGKHFAYGIMGRKGYEANKKELEGLAQGEDGFVFNGAKSS
jgi:glucose-6-phosphate isomerase